MKTVKSLSALIGQAVLVRFEQVKISCIVLDAKNSYGNVRLQVRPVAGEGEQWIEPARLERGNGETLQKREG